MRGVISLTFDDGYEAVYTHVVPLLNKYKIPGVFALPLETKALVHTTGQPIKPWPEWLSLREHGHEIAAHGVSHQVLSSLSGTALEVELVRPRDTLQATTLVYPGGAYSDSVVAEVKKYYAAARTTDYGFESSQPSDLWRLKTVDYTQSNWSLAKANLRALWAVATNCWLIETYHLIYPTLDGVDNEETMLHHSVRFDQFKRHLEFIRTLPISIQTIHETVRRRHN